MGVALEIEHRVDDVLQHPGAGQGAFLGDVAHQQQGDAHLLGLAGELLGAFPHLGDAAGGGLELLGVDGLDGVDHDQFGPYAVDRSHHVGDRRLGRQVEQWVQGDLQPDFTLLFDVPLEIARARIAQRAAQTQEALDKFEQESFDFLTRTREAYLQRAAQSPQRMAVIDSTQSLDDVKRQIREAMAVRTQLALHLD